MLALQVAQEVPHLHQGEPANLHRPWGTRQGCRGLARGWATPLPHAGGRAGGAVPAGRPPTVPWASREATVPTKVTSCNKGEGVSMPGPWREG